MIKNRNLIIIEARRLRYKGLSHRQIASVLNVSSSSAFNFTEGIKISIEQHLKLVRNTGIFKHSKEERAKWSSSGSKNWLARLRYSKRDLIQKIRIFYKTEKRIPTKRDFNSHWQSYRRIFGSWNRAISEAGFTINPEMFTHKFTANDSHVCDSFAEKIIDDWLHARKIPHERNVYYPQQKKFTVDFLVYGKYWIEFFGLKGQLKSYDSLYNRKLKIAKENVIEIVKLLPDDLFPISKLNTKLSFLLK